MARFVAFSLMALTSGASVAAQTGEFDGDLARLKTFYTAPQPGQSNHYLDMWDGGRVRSLTAFAGLTNNRALFINSHGKGHRTRAGLEYAFYAHQTLGGTESKLYSIRDVANLLGSHAVEIHNVIIAGCDLDRSFDASAVRRCFPNATNITHTVSGEAGYQPMYVQAILSPSQGIEPLYETASLTPQGETQYQLSADPSPRAKKLSPYIAKLYKPGARKPFRTQLAGRELLDSPSPTVTLANAMPR